ncbi:small subunit processome component 20 homolog [Anopheles cruzii]|uniref:small subunit processome component 20 homolog n=1 Tax=Anopheles cruzii TaxID=68878 RepID=UPI0022EC7A4F|nr:small subunit processome component 20 homolog [Anopheles cruzii]
MKNKPLKHKGANAFHFKSFRDRIKDIDVRQSALYRVETDHDLPDREDGTFFHAALRKWSLLNLTNEYIAYQRQFKDTITLPLLLFNKDTILTHLLTCLDEATDAALEPLLELVVALAKDLRNEFHFHFARVFDVLKQFLHSPSADRVEWTLLCLAHLFKVLRSFLRNDFIATFHRLSPMLDESSNPLHVVDFATECLGYLARDLKDKRVLLNQLLKWQMQDDGYTVACGRLLFELLHGVQDQFHTMAKRTMQQYFVTLQELDQNEADRLQDILTQTITDIVERIQPGDISIFWDTMRSTIDSCLDTLQNAEDSEARAVEYLTRLLQLSGIVLEHKEGRLLGDGVSATVSQLIRMLTIQTVAAPSSEFSDTIVNQIIVLLRSKYIHLTQLEVSRLVLNVLMLEQRPLYERFIASTVHCSMFEALIWPNFVKMLDLEMDDARLHFLANLLLQKVPLCGNGEQLREWKPFPVNVKPNGQFVRYVKALLSIESLDSANTLNNFELLLSLVIVLPHLKNVGGLANVSSILGKLVHRATNEIKDDLASSKTPQVVHLIAVTVETIVHLQEIEGHACLDLVERLLSIVTVCNCLMLNSVHLLVQFIMDRWKDIATYKWFLKQHSSLHPLLSSYDCRVRKMVSGIFAKFVHLPQLTAGMGPLYATIARIECIEPLIHTYREQLLLFQDLAYESNLHKQSFSGAQSEWTETVLRYMMAVFAINFKLLWEPAATIIKDYADSMTKSEETLFWKVYESMLTMAEAKLPHQAHHEISEMETDDSEDASVQQILHKVKSSFGKHPNIDYHHVHIQLLATLRKCTTFCRSKGSLIVERFYTFLGSADQSSAISDLSTEIDSGEKLNSETKRKSSKGAGKHTQQVLLCYLNICSDLDRKSLGRKANCLYATYETLASSRNEDIQKAALTGIFSFGNADLTPYKDFFFRVTNDKLLKNALLSAFVAENGEKSAEFVPGLQTTIAEEHRPAVIKLLLKVLDGKIMQNLGSTSDAGQHKATIVNFIGRLRVTELEILLQRWYEPYLLLLQQNPIETVGFVLMEIENGSTKIPSLPPYKMNTALNMLTALQTEVAPLQAASFVARVMHLKIVFDAVLVQMSHAVYKKYKSNALRALVDVFEQYDEGYCWTEEEIEAIMQVHVWPQVENLPSDSIHSPTPLLKLLLTWSRSDRLYVLLKRQRYQESPKVSFNTPLDAMIALLRGQQTSSGVCQEIFAALAAMLECEPSASVVDVNHTATGRSSILIPYVKELMQYIRNSLKHKKTISTTFLVILNRLAELGLIGGDRKDEASAEDDRNSLLNLILPILIRKVTKEGILGEEQQHEESKNVRLLHTIILRLLKKAKEPERFIKQIATLLFKVNDLESRKILIEMYEDLSVTSRSAEWQLVADLVRTLNAMDKRWIGQPDHATRTSGFRLIDDLLPEQITGNVAIVFLSQAMHMLQFGKDFSTRQHAFDYVCKVIVHLAEPDSCGVSLADMSYCIDKIVLVGIMNGLKLKRDTERRNESIQLLGELARRIGRSSGPAFRVFTDLWHFTGQAPGVGKELDFFDNVTHLQTHQHRKALKRFAKKLLAMVEGDDGCVLAPRTTVQFLLPIVSYYVCNDDFRKQTNLVEEAGNSIINICRTLPWRNYQAVLQHYLTRLKYSWEYQKQLLRIVIGIMDAFHFDLSAAAQENREQCLAPNRLNALTNKKLALCIPNDESVQTDAETEIVADPDSITEGNEESESELVENLDQAEEQKSNDKSKIAKEIVADITRTIIPKLLSSFNYATESSKSQGALGGDKKARFAKQKEEMLKLPIAIAIVKLFMKLPRKQIEVNLPKLVIKVITFMKSRLKTVRANARNILAHITVELGPAYLSFVLQNLLAMLTRGFQRHVLTFTVHTIIERAQKHLADEQVLADILQTVLQICTEDIFGQLIGIINGTTVAGGSLKITSAPEAKSDRKPYQTLFLLGQHAREQMLADLFAPFCGVLTKYRTHHTVKKVQDAFRRLAEGIVANETIDPESLLLFIYGMMSGKMFDQCTVAIESASDQHEDDSANAVRRKHLLGDVPKPGAIFLIPAEPKRYGMASAATGLDYNHEQKENDPVFLECGLEILVNFTKGKYIEARNDCDREACFKLRLNPIVPLLVQSLDSKHSKIICLALNCLSALWASRITLECLERRETMDAIVKSIFSILHRYNTVALDANESNFSMVRASFKAIVALFKFYKRSYQLSTEQLQLLVLYIEQDISVGGGRQSMAFVLLRSIIARRLNFSELNQLMEKLFAICIRSESVSERSECRQIIVEYIMNYPMGKKVQQHLLYFTDQLQYEVPSGRQSAAQLLKELFQKLPKEVVEKNSEALFFALGVRLANEDTSEIRALVAECIETLLKRLDTKRKANVMTVVQEMLIDRLLKHRELGAQLLLRIMHSEPTPFFISSWLDNVLPALLLNLVPQTNVPTGTDNTAGKFVKPIVAPVTTLLNADPSGDHLIIQTLHVFEGLLRLHPTLLTDEQYNDTVDSLAYTLQTLLASGHQWVRLGALRLLYAIINTLDFDAIHKTLQKASAGNLIDEESNDSSETASTPGKQFLYHAPLRDCKSLTLDLCAQLTPDAAMVNELDDEAAGLVTQILFLLANILRVVPLDGSKNKINLYWLVRRVRYVIQSEIVKNPNVYTLRKHAMHWLSSVVPILDDDTLKQLAPALLIPAVRELSDLQNTTATASKPNGASRSVIGKIATKLCKEISNRLGTITYDKIRTALEQSLVRKRTDRRVQLAQEKINFPLMAARRKDNKKIRTQNAKKRKVQKQNDLGDSLSKDYLANSSGTSKKRQRHGNSANTSKRRRTMESMFKSN